MVKRATFLALTLAIGFALAGPALTAPRSAPPAPVVQPEHVVLFVLEGFGKDSLKTGAMPVINRLVKNGSVAWSATAVNPPLRLPTMASIFTGLPVEKHGMDWDTFDFARGYPRPPLMFDYLDLGGGKDTAVFFMDESLYQLARPASYVDYQVCGRLRPECRASMVVTYVREYFKKGEQGGYNHYVYALPHLLIVHLPDAGRAGSEQGWTSKAYAAGLKDVDDAIGSILDIYKTYKLLDNTMVIVTALNGIGEPKQNGSLPHVPWIASGANIKSGHTITMPVSIMDTGATIMRAFGLETHTEWQSRPIEEIFRAPREVVRNQPALNLHGQ
jgi:predicted AlkP superfamily pyrophosphatase or phosphodiesterase